MGRKNKNDREKEEKDPEIIDEELFLYKEEIEELLREELHAEINHDKFVELLIELRKYNETHVTGLCDRLTLTKLIQFLE